MFSWNNPYILAVIIGVIAGAFNYYNQKQNKAEVNMTHCLAYFLVASGVLLAFYYFTGNSSISILPTPQTGGTSSKINLNDLKIQPGLPDF
jgi:hypothetical protein